MDESTPADESCDVDATGVRVGTIIVEVWMGEATAYPTVVIEGLSEFEAIGYLSPLLDELRDQVRGVMAVGVVYDNEEEEADDEAES